MARGSSLGILKASKDEVPGSVQLLGKENKPLGIDPERPPSPSHPSEPHEPPHQHHLHRPHSGLRRRRSSHGYREPEPKKTVDGIILDPQPGDAKDDPLNWPSWRRDMALLTIGWHSLLGGGMTPVLAAGFNDVAETYGVSVPAIALTTGLYMLGLGIGSLIASPLAILYGKRPVYLGGAVIFFIASIWCALSPTYVSLIVARIVQGLGVSPCECLPSATIAEIFFLHERAYRVGIYTLLLLGGKNIVPLVSGVIVQSLGWRWVFWIVSIIVGLNTFLIFLFVPETWWDRTPHPKPEKPGLVHRISDFASSIHLGRHHRSKSSMKLEHSKHRVGDPNRSEPGSEKPQGTMPSQQLEPEHLDEKPALTHGETSSSSGPSKRHAHFGDQDTVTDEGAYFKETMAPTGGGSHNNTLPSAVPRDLEKGYADSDTTVVGKQQRSGDLLNNSSTETPAKPEKSKVQRPPLSPAPSEARMATLAQLPGHDPSHPEHHAPAKTFTQQLRLWNGRLRKDSFFKAMLRPLVLYAYPAILWSTVVYSLSIGWLIVLSESVAHIYQAQPYNFSRLATGLVYMSPFIGGILGTAVAGKVSDVIARKMSKKNDGVYEPEFRLVMGLPIMITTAIGLMGFGWSAHEHDHWIVPTLFFGIISFGCSLGSTTAITFCVDSYRQYAGEALVTLNFSKNVLHGFVFSLFFNRWLEHDGSKTVFVAIGSIQIICLAFTLPLYIYGKRFRLWTVESNLMAKL